MTEKIQVLWVDDDLNRKEDAKNIESSGTDLKIEFVHPKDLQQGNENVDLFIIDLFLNRKGNLDGQGYEHTGLVAASEVRENYPEVPIYLVTQNTDGEDPKLARLFRAAKLIFDKLVTFQQIQRTGAQVLYDDALDYKSIIKAKRGDIKELFSLLKAPEDAKSRLELAFPSEFKKGLTLQDSNNIEANALTFARWVRETLLTIPGFLYNVDYASVYMGVEPTAFGKISSQLEETQYNGIFSKTTQQLWWVSALDDFVFSSKESADVTHTDVWKLAPSILKATDDDLAKCRVCGEIYPETVGLNLANGKYEPVHYRCSNPYKDVKSELYFDEPRAFTPPD